MTSRKRGAKPILQKDPQAQNVLKSLIIKFDEEHNIKPTVGYKDIYLYVKAQEMQHSLPFKSPSYTWWKTTGKALVDEYNRVKAKTLIIGEDPNDDVPDISFLLSKFGGVNQEILREHLINLHTYMAGLVQKVNCLQNNLDNQELELDQLRKGNEELKQKNLNMMSLVTALFLYSNKSNNELTNMLNTGKSRSEVVNISLTQTFGTPDAFVKELVKHVSPRGKTEGSARIVPFYRGQPDQYSPHDDDYDY